MSWFSLQAKRTGVGKTAGASREQDILPSGFLYTLLSKRGDIYDMFWKNDI
jgi:hypothetical protein